MGLQRCPIISRTGVGFRKLGGVPSTRGVVKRAAVELSDPHWLLFPLDPMPYSAVIETLRHYMLEERMQRLASVTNYQMRGLCVVLESLYDPGNQAAVLRSADAHGLLDVHIIKPENATKANARQVSRGAEKWLDIHRYDESIDCIQRLKSQGFQIAVSDLTAAQPLDALDFSKPTAVVFGNERFGISEEMAAAADVRFVIPMYGFVQSFNIAVAAGITLHTARLHRERALGSLTDLTPEERQELLAVWMCRSVEGSEQLLSDAGIEISSELRTAAFPTGFRIPKPRLNGQKPAIGKDPKLFRGRLD